MARPTANRDPEPEERMMMAIDILMDEHGRIEQVLDALEGYALRLGRDADPADLGRFVDFVRGYADAIHHGKEEAILFEAMIAGGYRADSGPVAVYLREHTTGRELIATLAEAASSSEGWTADDVERVRTTALRYVALLRRHIEKEDAVLFPMAESHFGPDEMERMGGQFEDFDEMHRIAGATARLLATGDYLTGKYPAPAPADRHPGPIPPLGDACQELCNRFDCVYSPMEDDHASWKD